MDFIKMIVYYALFMLIGVGGYTAILKWRAKVVLSNLKNENFEHIKVKFSKVGRSKYKSFGGWRVNAEMYFNKDFIMICTSTKGFMSGMNTGNLPVIYTDKVDELRMKAKISNIIHPDEAKITSINNLSIKYQKMNTSKTNYIIRIKFENRADMEKLKLAGNRLLENNTV